LSIPPEGGRQVLVRWIHDQLNHSQLWFFSWMWAVNVGGHERPNGGSTAMPSLRGGGCKIAQEEVIRRLQSGSPHQQRDFRFSSDRRFESWTFGDLIRSAQARVLLENRIGDQMNQFVRNLRRVDFAYVVGRWGCLSAQEPDDVGGDVET
jgi:hypothetical protein